MTEYIAPVADWSQAREFIKNGHEKGLKAGFTNGCFDILHAGHVTYLAEARSLCDRLIVGLNADSSVKRLKGASRPVHDEKARALVLAGLKAVDMVVLFGDDVAEEDKAIRVIEALRPDLYFKGGDYDVADVPEAPAVQAYGGTVKILSNVKGYSTTAAIEKMGAP